MASRKRHDERRRVVAEDLNTAYRTIALRAEGEIAADAGIPVVLMTENTVRAYDWERGEIVDEIAILSGVDFPKQVPLLDSHNRWSATAQMGSVRKLTKGAESIDGQAFFSRKQVAQELRQDVLDGHATDASVGFRVLEKKWVDKGQSLTIRGKTYQGPVRLVTRSQIFELSITPIGADSRSKFSPSQRAYFDPEGLREEKAVDEELRKLLVSRGMPENLSNEEAVRWADKNFPKPAAAPPAAPPAPPVTQRTEPAAPPAPSAPVDAEAIRREAAEGERTRIAGIENLVRMATLVDGVAVRDDLVKRGVGVDEAARHILEKQAAGNGAPLRSGDNTQRIAPGAAEVDKLRSAVSDGLNLRAGGFADKDHKPADGANEFRGRSLIEIGREICERAGLNTRSMGPSEIAMRLLGIDDASNFSFRGEGSAFYNVSGMFNAVVADVAHNSLRKSYTETPTTYQRWAKKGPEFTDFKDRANSILGEFPDPKAIPENDEMPEVTYSDSKEGYSVEIYALMFSITLQAIMNNALNAFTDAPSKMGRTFARKLNKLCVNILTANDALTSDGIALFNASHNNLGTAGVISKTTLDELYKLMMLQTGLNSNVLCGAVPKYVLMPPGDSGDALQFFGSRSVAVATGGNSETKNIYGPDGDRTLVPIVEAQLHANSATAWYGLADPSDIDTIEYSFLEGFSTPTVMRDQPINRLGVRYAAVQGFAAKALDYRGVFKNTG
jgi:hypothetical protein